MRSPVELNGRHSHCVGNPKKRGGGPGPSGGLGLTVTVSESLILEVVLEREPGSGSIHFSAYGCIAFH